jgi:proline iminopeptidase
MEDYYPASTPYNKAYLRVDARHELYYEEFGNPAGIPVVYLHGGPGGGHGPNFHRFFDPAAFRIVIYDQRGAGQSKPFADITDNTPDLLVEDNEKLRAHLGIDRWHVFGGSWGSTLALLYAQAHPDKTLSLTLRGIFMMRQKELDVFYKGNRAFPEEFQKLYDYIPAAERHDLVAAYFHRISAGDAEAARVWSRYEGMTSWRVKPDKLDDESDTHLIGMATMETHFFLNCRFQPDDRILQNIDIIRKAGIPGVIIQGRYDSVCPLESAWDLHRAWPEAGLEVTDAGHAGSEVPTRAALIRATNNIRDFGSPLAPVPPAASA